MCVTARSIMWCMPWYGLPFLLISIPMKIYRVSSTISVCGRIEAAIIEAWDNIDATVLKELVYIVYLKPFNIAVLLSVNSYGFISVGLIQPLFTLFYINRRKYWFREIF